MKKVIAIDVDLTVVDSLKPWLDWFYHWTGKRVVNDDGAYDLVPEMKRLIKDSNCVQTFDPFSFWKKPDLYDNLIPLPGSVEAVDRFIEAGHDVVFVSSCVTEHTDSKINFLKRFFHEDCKFISTHHKEFVNYDVLIDDRIYHMAVGSAKRPESLHLLFTGIRADGNQIQRMRYMKINSWDQLLNYTFLEKYNAK